jgi:twinkle protein
VKEFYSSQPYSPEKIISLSDLKHLLFDDPPVPIADYPWEGLNNMTGGIWPGELVTIKAPPKVGKSTCIGEIVNHLHETKDLPIGLIYLEETQRDLIYKFATLTLNKNLQRPEIRSTVSHKELLGAAESFLASDNIFLVDHFGSCSSDFLEDKITELVLAKGCQFIFFDHISMAITDESNKDERIALDRLITAIKALTVGIPDEISETISEVQPDGTKIDKVVNKVIMRQPTVFMVTHVNDNGQPRGSRAALQISNTVISLERDKLSKDKLSKNTTNIVVEENRRFGESGLACQLLYNRDTGRLSEIPRAEFEEDDTPPVMDSKYVYHP